MVSKGTELKYEASLSDFLLWGSWGQRSQGSARFPEVLFSPGKIILKIDWAFKAAEGEKYCQGDF